MHQAKAFKYGFASFILVLAVAGCSLLTVHAQETKKTEPATKKTARKGRDPFVPYRVAVATVKLQGGPVIPPTILQRIEQYRAQKLAAMNAHLPAPKPTTALLLSEIQVVGISRTPRGYAAIIEATPIKLSYVIYPGERLYDGQLVAIEDARLVFRREVVWTDGRRDRTVEMKALRQPSAAETMTAAKTETPTSAAAESEKKPEDKPPATEKP
jgi:hypothetical protein